MNEVESAVLMLAGVTLALLAIVFAIWWSRRPRTAPAAPRVPREPREIRLPKLSRKTAPEVEEVEISPSRLARISRKAPLEIPAQAEYEISPEPVAVAEPVEVALEPVISGVEDEAHRIEKADIEEVTLRLIPQIPPRDAISTNSWLGGRPHLPAGMEWPRIDDQPADFLAQISCADLPQDLWGGLGPRDGALAFFIHRRKHTLRVLHLRDTGMPVAPPFTLNDPEGWFGPHGGLASGDLASFAVRAFPEWPVDLVAVRPGDTDPRSEGDPDEPGAALHDRGYDIADPAFHPFDWGSMTAMVALLEQRLDRLMTEAPPEADTDNPDEMEQCAALNREARARAEEIIAIVRDGAGRADFSAGDATAVMAGLHAIRWVKVIRSAAPETGAEQVETITLPLTTHRADANLWVHDYQTILFDRAKHAWCANPDNLSAPARALFEPWWRTLAEREMAAMGHEPFRHVPDYDEERDAVLLELPTSGLMSRIFGDRDNLVVTIDKANLAIGDFSKLRVQVSS
ncbi:hypothetical protein ATE68_09135 [Sphingopyxis sp. H038]|uniref:DUF1963 domain-containing protein n=1 Tax=unclassified Sphingopyxis TaxID=2614943 RepID=UPI000730F066|nr:MULTISPECIES: DUF1963 domain-containing protein [unclassified Sphingopyxis]KTE03830.1 hypothetical protein ATE78_05545 [Sphingopyxis sp. H012]KTE04857.1 hypothetical protein ATE76_23035 [Sphingopyxis sp. H093]KTE09293.1 hypothetical protein ATE70_15740 [Sphingopyxis sp. H053]KTE17212.1 hypothetical protein ATE75_23965 [Sphingopyxis sp. H080]KTE34959.1 hypothetical protein ATE73_23170 [Sphingopyxis sp. H077]